MVFVNDKIILEKKLGRPSASWDEMSRLAHSLKYNLKIDYDTYTCISEGRDPFRARVDVRINRQEQLAAIVTEEDTFSLYSCRAK